jgi:hypothetical protein
MPQFHVCRTCGYAEEGWGAGYWKLTAKPTETMSHDNAWKFVRKFIRQGNMAALGRYGSRRMAAALEEK